jgi:hypothetical protein
MMRSNKPESLRLVQSWMTSRDARGVSVPRETTCYSQAAKIKKLLLTPPHDEVVFVEDGESHSDLQPSSFHVECAATIVLRCLYFLASIEPV